VQNSPASALSLTPAPCGWRATVLTERGDACVQEAPSFAEAVTAGFALISELRLAKGKARTVPVTVALPTRLAVHERLTLPSEDRDELTGMVRLQFEKSLPYPVEETSVGFQILSKSVAPAPPPDADEVQGLDEPKVPAAPLVQTTLLACGVHHAAAANLCASILDQQFPQRLTLWAMHVAAQAPAGETACGLWREEDDLAFGIFENRRLGFVEILSSPDDALATLPRTLMSAEMAGAPVAFHTVLLDPSLAAMSDSLAKFLGAPVLELTAQAGELPPGELVDFTPEAWRVEQARRERFRTRRNWIGAAAALYLVLVVGALAYLGIQSGRLGSLKKEAAALQSRGDTVLDRQTRWKALTPAIDRRRFTVELLFQTCQSLPGQETRITRFEFDLAKKELQIEGEALNPQQAVAFAEKLKACPELSDFRFEWGQPVILPNEHAQFRIFGNL